MSKRKSSVWRWTVASVVVGVLGIVVMLYISGHPPSTNVNIKVQPPAQPGGSGTPAPDDTGPGVTPPTSPTPPPVPVIKIEFTQVPGVGGGPDSRGDISGRVTGLQHPQQYKIVIYALTDKWYVQPMVVTPFTDIDSAGTWSNWTHLGIKYAVLVVTPSYKPQSEITGALPSTGDKVLAIATTRAR